MRFVVFVFLFFFFSGSISAFQIPYSKQMRLMELCIKYSSKPWEKLVIGFGPQTHPEYQELLLAFKGFKPQGKDGEIPFQIQQLDSFSVLEGIDILYLFPDQEIPDSLTIFSFVTRYDQVQKGATIGMVLKDTVPKLVFNARSLRRAGIFFPSGLLNLSEVIEQKENNSAQK